MMAMRLRVAFLLLCVLASPVRTLVAQDPAKSVGTASMHIGRWTYHARAERKDQHQDIGERTVDVSDTTIDGTRAWLVVTRMNIEGQIVADSVAIASSDHHALLRNATLGDARITMVVSPGDSMARGLLVRGNSIVPLNVRLGTNSYLNYYALRATLPDLPVAAGWTEQAETLELGARPRFFRVLLTVDGEEELTVDAGTFDCWIVHVTGEGGIDERYWVSKAEHYVVRTREPIDNAGSVLQLDLASLTLGGAAQPSTGVTPMSAEANPASSIVVSTKIGVSRDRVRAAIKRTMSDLGYELMMTDSMTGAIVTRPKHTWPAGSDGEAWHGATNPGVSLVVRTRSLGADSTSLSVTAISPTPATPEMEKVSTTLRMMSALEFANALTTSLHGARMPALGKP